MDKEQAIQFLTEECSFPVALTSSNAEELWASHRAVLADLPPEETPSPRKLPLSAADLKAARKFRSRHPEAEFVVDFVRLDPLDLILHQLWISTTISERYRNNVTPDLWLKNAVLDPPSHSGLQWHRENNAVVFDLPHSEFVLAGPWQPDGQMRIAEPKGFVTVAFHADRALLLSGYHRTFACAQYTLEATNAPHGVLFCVSNQLLSLGSEAEDVTAMMEGPRPPRMADFFDDRFSLPVTLRRRRYQMRVYFEVAAIDEEQAQTAAGQDPLSGSAAAHVLDLTPGSSRDCRLIFENALGHHQAGRIDQAVAGYRRVLFLKPDHADAHYNLGSALAELHDFDDAVTHYERALALKPGWADAHNNLANALLEQGRIDDATAHYRQALSADDAHAGAHFNLGNVFKELGRFDDALTHYARTIAIQPRHVRAHHNRAEIKTFHRGDPDLAALETMAGADDLSVEEALYIHFALAKALEDIGDDPRAFDHLRKGNALQRRRIAYDEARRLGRMRRIADAFDSGLFHRFKREGNPSLTPIFVLGMPRSGSTLIEQILAGHPQIHAAGERKDFETAVESAFAPAAKRIPWPDLLADLDGAALQRIGEAYIDSLPARPEGKTRIVDKMPGNFLYAGLIRLVFPNARIVHTVRNPVDTCVSCYSKWFQEGQDYSYDLAELGRYYRGYRNLMDHWRSVLPPDSIRDVVYEEVVDDLEGQARRLIEYCGLSWDDRCLRFYETSRIVKTASAVQVRKPLFRTSVQRWRKHEANLGPLLGELGNLASQDLQHVRSANAG